MHWLRGCAIGLVGLALVAACGSERVRDGDSDQTGEVSQAITAACNLDTIGLPCDPDGPAGAKLECEGVCGISTSGLVSCQNVTAGALDGVICGTTNGVGDNACKRHCSGKTCLLSNAPAGAACRPNNKSHPCEGQCDGAGKCGNIGNACDFGRDEQLCKFATCNFADATKCVVKNLARTTLCSDADACSIGRCNNAGTCVAGPTVGCDDGNACTDDSCDPQDGGCVGVNDDTNACSDGNACLTGEHCSAGTCVAGTTPVDCDDNDPCTIDSCDPNTGCAHVPKCSDGNACTQDVCDPQTGACSNPAAPACNDGDACTTDTCDALTGCVFTAVNCDDGDACTSDGCSAGNCTHAAISCDDGNACTEDSCSGTTGCMNVLVQGCGGEGGGGPVGAGGEPGAGGAGEPGGGGDGGMPTGVADGGAPDVGAAGDGSGGTGQAGSSPGGASNAGSGATPASGATSGSSAGGNDSVPNRTVEAGCGCRAVGARRDATPLLALLLGAGLVVARRRRAA